LIDAVLEQGRLIFYYRPKVGTHEAKTMDDVQRLYMVMEPIRTAIGEDAKRAAEIRRHYSTHAKSHKGKGKGKQATAADDEHRTHTNTLVRSEP
jgi:hypothetical protein